MAKQDEFVSYEFIEDHNILTNVEDYSRKVRSEADAYAEKEHKRIAAESQRSQELREQAEQILQEAQEKADRINQEAQQEREVLLEESRKEGYAAGYTAGEAEAMENGRERIANLQQLLQEISSLKMRINQESEQEVLETTMLMARMILSRELKTDPQLVLKGIRQVMKGFEGLGNIKIFTNPVDLEFLQGYHAELSAYLDEAQQLSFKPDAHLTPGESVTLSDFTEVRKEFARQLAVLDQALLQCHEQRRLLYEATAQKSPKNEPKTED